MKDTTPKRPKYKITPAPFARFFRNFRADRPRVLGFAGPNGVSPPPGSLGHLGKVIFSSAQLGRALPGKSEIRSTKSETNPKSEIPNRRVPVSDFVLRVCFGFR